MRQTDTAIESYRQIEPTLTSRQTFVREQLRACFDAHGTWPTGLELLRFVVTTQPAARRFDVNSIRPRLQELTEQGYVQKGPKRICTISGKRVYTWQTATPRPLDLSKAEQMTLGPAA